MDSILVKINDKDDRTITYTRVVEKNKERVKRIFTIAYRVYPERKSMNIEFAASVYRNDQINGKDEVFVRKHHVHTARGRLAVRPLFATFPMSEEYVKCLSSYPVYDANDTMESRKDKRRKWNETEECRIWKDIRRRFDEEITAFLRRQISLHGVRNKTRVKPSDTIYDETQSNKSSPKTSPNPTTAS